MEESLVKIVDYMTAVGVKKTEASATMPGYAVRPQFICVLGEGGWDVSVHAGYSGAAVSIRHPKLGEALRRVADNLPPLPEK